MADEHSPKMVSLKVMVDKANQRVVFAEANASFVDTLFSFLTLPLGTIIKTLRSKQPTLDVSCINNLYLSVQRLEPDQFRTTACKNMLLKPQNAARDRYRRVPFKVDDDWEESTRYYLCPDGYCCLYRYNRASVSEGTQCACGKEMTKMKTFPDIGCPLGAFVEERAVFVIDDELRVMPLSTTAILSMLQGQGIAGKCGVLEERVVSVEVFQLLVSLLYSKTPLTDLMLAKKVQLLNVPFNTRCLAYPKTEMDSTAGKQVGKVRLKLILRKSDGKLLYAEAGADFIDLIFSFLTYPLGAVVELLGGNSPMQCLNTVYNSIKDMSCDGHFKSYECKDLLLHPKLAPYFMCNSQLLEIDEKDCPMHYIYNCDICLQCLSPVVYTPPASLHCEHGKDKISLNMVNPKLLTGNTTSGGGFVKRAAIFMVTDDLVVTPFSSISVISLLDRIKFPICDLEEKVVSAGETEALNLLKASLMSNTALTDIFSPVILSP